MPSQSTRSSGFLEFEQLAPLLTRLGEIAEDELPEPSTVEVRAWDDGTFTATAYHNRGRDIERGRTAREFVRYEREQEAFVYVHVEERNEDRKIIEERKVGSFDNPVE